MFSFWNWLMEFFYGKEEDHDEKWYKDKNKKKICNNSNDERKRSESE